LENSVRVIDQGYGNYSLAIGMQLTGGCCELYKTL